MRPLTILFALAGLLTFTAECSLAQLSGVAVAGNSKLVTVGAFMISVPTEWVAFAPNEANALRQQYAVQSAQIYRQYSRGSRDPSSPIGLAAFHIAGSDGAFIVVSFSVPPQSDLINLLKSQAKDKADFGVREGIISNYLGLTSINDEQFSGFYTTTIGRNGNVQVSGGLEHKKLKNTIIQLTLLSPQSWDQGRATDALTAVLRSTSLGGTNVHTCNCAIVQFSLQKPV